MNALQLCCWQFYTKELWSRLSSSEVRFYREKRPFCILSPLKGLKDNVRWSSYARFYELGISRESRYILGIRNKSVLRTLKYRAIPEIRHPRDNPALTSEYTCDNHGDEFCWQFCRRHVDIVLEPTSQIDNNNLVRPSQNARGSNFAGLVMQNKRKMKFKCHV